ncbi:MAG TPA: IPT/TIG domain-containing protein [Anaerolineae bacterium]|nr:IPT/TIG domain-containing protein [Anaerolineae bacterium]
MPIRRLTRRELEREVRARIARPAELRDWLGRIVPLLEGPKITHFDPLAGQRGCVVTIYGSNFSPDRLENSVEIGGGACLVVSASATELKVVTGGDVESGPVKVTVAGDSAAGPQDFKVLGYPSAGAGEDGPPMAFSGEGAGAAGDVPAIGTIRVLVALVRPNDLAPAGTGARDGVVDAWNDVVTYYNQASYGQTVVQYDITTSWTILDGPTTDFVPAGADNIDSSQLMRIMAQAAQGAVDEGYDLDDYAMMAGVMFLNGNFIRAWGGWSWQNLAYDNGLPASDPDRVHINLTADHAINLIAIQETANWGRCAHEFGHNVVSAPSFTGDGTATLGEDVYSSDLVDPGAATARSFDLMGSHDSHPLFSGYHLEKLGYYSAANIHTLTWDRNPHSYDLDIVAHGLAQDAAANRYHLVKVHIAQGLDYYIQVRQRPGATAQIFDDSIPLDGANNQGGVIVTAVIADTLHTNQQTRFITLLHANQVLSAGESAEDPARALKISVLNDNVQARPLICRVRVEWAQTVVGDPNGSFDLSVTPWDSSYQSPDIWIDRSPFGAYDKPLDAQGRPTGNGDKPRPMQVNRFYARINVSGAQGATNVLTTFYAITPPGVGDNGNWAPILQQTIANIAANSHADTACNWTPVVGRHTCLMVYAGQQLGEISGGNNAAQENIFDFESPAGSPGTPVIVQTAIRNPTEERAMVQVSLKGVPEGWFVQFPHAWVWLDPKAERVFDVVIVPERDFNWFLEMKRPLSAPVKFEGMLPREYKEPLPPKDEPAGSRFYPIGGVLYETALRHKSAIELAEDQEHAKEVYIALRGTIQPPLAGQRVRVELVDPAEQLRVAEVETDAAGEFHAGFSLEFEPSLESDRKLWKRAGEIVKGTYRAQAFLFAASRAAEAESNLVFVGR